MPDWLQNFSQDQGMLLGVAVGGIILCLTLMMALVIFARRSSQIQKLRDRMSADVQFDGPKRTIRLWHDGEEASTTVPGMNQSMTVAQRLEKIREDAGWTMPAVSVLLAVAGVALALLVSIYLFFGNPVGALGAAICVVVVFYIMTRRRIDKRRETFERQLVESLELVARSLRAGHPLLGAFQLTAEETELPVRTIFSDICQQQELGAGIEDAMQKVALETGNADLKLFATTVAIQLRSGGNLADMMDRLAYVIRERIRLGRRVRVLTAQTQFSKRVLLVLPFFVFVVLYMLNPHYMKPLYSTPLGQLMSVLGVAALGIGTWMMNRLARLEY